MGVNRESFNFSLNSPVTPVLRVLRVLRQEMTAVPRTPHAALAGTRNPSWPQ